MIDAYDSDTAILLGQASTAMEYYARNGSDARKQRAIELMTEAAERLGFDLVPRKTPADLHAEALAKGRAEDAHDDDLLSQMGICDCDYCQARERGLADDGSDIEGGR